MTTLCIFNFCISHHAVKYSCFFFFFKRNTPAYKMQEFPAVSLIKIWRPAVLPSLSPQCAVGSLQPLYFSRSYLDAEKKWKTERKREREFFHSQPADILVCMWSPECCCFSFFLIHLKWPKFPGFISFRGQLVSCPRPSILAPAGRPLIIVVNIIVISDRRVQQSFCSLSSVIKELTEL